MQISNNSGIRSMIWDDMKNPGKDRISIYKIIDENGNINTEPSVGLYEKIKLVFARIIHFFNSFSKAYCKNFQEAKERVEKKLELHKKLEDKAKHGDSEAQFKLGKIYLEQLQFEPSIIKAQKWFDVDGDQYGHLGYTQVYLNKLNQAPTTQAMIKLLTTAAEQKHSEAQHMLAEFYYYGPTLYTAAERDSKSQHDIDMYRRPLTPTIKATIVNLYKSSAELNNAKAQYMMGVLFTEGKLVNKDLKEAFKWYERAAKNNYSLAQFVLADCYQFGKGVDIDLNQSKEWYIKSAAKNGGVSHMHLLALDIQLGKYAIKV